MYSHTDIAGRISFAPQPIENTNGGVSFSVAVNRGFGEKQQTDFYNCKAWGKTAENILARAKKGDVVFIGGEMQSRKTDKATYWDLNVEKFRFGPNPQNQNQDQGQQSQQQGNFNQGAQPQYQNQQAQYQNQQNQQAQYQNQQQYGNYNHPANTQGGQGQMGGNPFPGGNNDFFANANNIPTDGLPI